jgi:uncharacterized protein YPO0396
MDVQTTTEAALTDSLAPPTFVITHIELFDWGSFAGRHSAQIELEGTAIIGPTGSGKTTLVDALMTLIAANPRYNLASTGGHESDRDLVSYIRGVSGAGNNSGDNEHIARPGKTVSGIAARFSNGEKQLVIGAVFWLDGTSSAATDLGRLWIYSEAVSEGLDEWLEIHHAGGARALKQHARETSGLHVTSNKQEYLSHLRRFFEVGENAFTLLNRAAGLKQLNSIDEVFRELVLDDTSAFDRAAEVAKEFADLAAIHGELEIARQQQHSLRPIDESWRKRETLARHLDLQRQIKDILPRWYAEAAHRLATQRLARIDTEIDECRRKGEALCGQIKMADAEAETLRDIYLKAGGASIEQLRQQIQSQEQLVAICARNAKDYRRLAGLLELDAALTRDALAANQQRARELQTEKQALHERQKQEAWALGAAQQREVQARDELKAELDQVLGRPGSNVPGPYQLFRSELAGQLGLEEHALPFVAELIEVKAEESRWRGAIERAIGGHRTRIMVPADAIKAALRWINHRDNRMHVRLLEVETAHGESRFFPDGFTRKLKYKEHPYREALKVWLGGIDRHCVASPEQLHDTPHGLTEQGLMSDRRGLFEKQDQRRLDQDWMTGFDNKDRLAQLRKQITEVEGSLRKAEAAYEAARQRAEATGSLLTLLEALIAAEFDTIDLPGAEQALDSLQLRLHALSDPEGDAEKARLRWAEADRQIKALRQQEGDNDAVKRDLDRKQQEIADRRERAFNRIGAGLTDPQRLLAERHLPIPAGEVLENLSELELDATNSVQGVIEAATSQLNNCEQTLVRQMGAAKKVDTGALADVGQEMQDAPAYLERLRQLTEEALPEKLQRFLQYLNQSSDQGVTQLLSAIENEVSLIEERIEDLNRTLQRVDFNPGSYLRLVPQRVVHESLRTLQQAQRHLRSAEVKDDQGESHFRALQNIVAILRDASDRKKTLSARALLDPRYRLTFAVSVIERASGAVKEVRTGSQGGSGGEKEIIASYVLTASLSYALCPDGSARPLFGTIVLDEAFSKSSQAVAGRIISALHEFGLHPLFVTPNKELRLLRAHTRSAILVHRRGRQATLTSVTWEELEDHARRRAGGPNEIAS